VSYIVWHGLVSSVFLPPCALALIEYHWAGFLSGWVKRQPRRCHPPVDFSLVPNHVTPLRSGAIRAPTSVASSLALTFLGIIEIGAQTDAANPVVRIAGGCDGLVGQQRAAGYLRQPSAWRCRLGIRAKVSCIEIVKKPGRAQFPWCRLVLLKQFPLFRHP
jgi:hypothetical protein